MIWWKNFYIILGIVAAMSGLYKLYARRVDVEKNPENYYEEDEEENRVKSFFDVI